MEQLEGVVVAKQGYLNEVWLKEDDQTYYLFFPEQSLNVHNRSRLRKRRLAYKVA